MAEDRDNNILEEQDSTGIIEQVNIDEEMRSAYIDYSMSVIVSRALPDARDGLKPVQRRVLFGMDGLGLSYNVATRKSAKVVGEVLGKYHPHGDSSVYDAMARLAQNWNQRYPLVFGQGNFGSMDGDPVAAMRYTEAKLEKITESVLADLDKKTVDFMNNFDDTEQEPTVLPTKVPLLLLNGSSGIAVGMATNMAPHNLGEVCDAICAYIDNPEITVDELLQYIKGPDFPTGGIIQGIQGIKDAYETGRGRIVIRSKTEIEVGENGRETIVVTEVPYMVNKREMIEKIGQMVEDKKIEGITYINDETSREGVRVIIRVKQGYNSSVVLNTLFKYTALQSSFSINNVALVGGRPKTLSLKDMLKVFVDFRHDVVVRRTQFDLEKAQKRAHILEGLLKAIDVIDEIIRIIRASASVDEAKATLMETFGFTEIQATAIVEMRLRQLTGLEREKLQAEYDDLEKFIAYCQEVLASTDLQMKIIKDETQEVKAKYADARRTMIVPDEGEFNPEDFYPNEDVVITLSHLGYIKRTALTEYSTQNRGGKGKKGGTTRDEDFMEHLFIANMHATLMFLTTSGKCYWLKVYQIPEQARASKGRAIQNVLNIPDDKIKAILHVRSFKDKEFNESHFVTLVTKSGLIKKTNVDAYSHVSQKGIYAIKFREDDELVTAIMTNGHEEIYIATKYGQCCRFDESKVRPMGRTSMGVKGITLEEGDEVVGAISYDPSSEKAASRTVLVVSENGYGKRCAPDDYRLTNRGGKGVKTITISEKTGSLVSIQKLTEGEQLMIICRSGLAIRMKLDTVRVMGRQAAGVKLIDLNDGDSIASLSIVPADEDKEDMTTGPEGGDDVLGTVVENQTE